MLEKRLIQIEENKTCWYLGKSGPGKGKGKFYKGLEVSVCLNLSVERTTGGLEGPEQREESSRRLRALPTNTKTWDFILTWAQEGWEQE